MLWSPKKPLRWDGFSFWLCYCALFVTKDKKNKRNLTYWASGQIMLVKLYTFKNTVKLCYLKLSSLEFPTISNKFLFPLRIGDTGVQLYLDFHRVYTCKQTANLHYEIHCLVISIDKTIFASRYLSFYITTTFAHATFDAYLNVVSLISRPDGCLEDKTL